MARLPRSSSSMKLREFLRLHHELARRHADSLRDVVGDSIMLSFSPIARVVRTYALRSGAVFRARARLDELRVPITPPPDQIEFEPNLAIWTGSATADVN